MPCILVCFHPSAVIFFWVSKGKETQTTTTTVMMITDGFKSFANYCNCCSPLLSFHVLPGSRLPASPVCPGSFWISLLPAPKRSYLTCNRIIDDGPATQTGNQIPKELIRFLRNSSGHKTNNFPGAVGQANREKWLRRWFLVGLPLPRRIKMYLYMHTCESPQQST